MMTQKTIALPEDIYEDLKKRKRKDESFPQLIARLLNNAPGNPQPLEALKGALEDDAEEWEQIEKMLYERRRRPNLPRNRGA